MFRSVPALPVNVGAASTSAARLAALRAGTHAIRRPSPQAAIRSDPKCPQERPPPSKSSMRLPWSVRRKC
ncbi:hypothetical protein AN219_35875 [Streptomyces nanshensis]|nr:hypothetical protein AN219_35875 [Streptomyces nanshensis]